MFAHCKLPVNLYQLPGSNTDTGCFVQLDIKPNRLQIMKNVHFSILSAIMKITAIPVLIMLGSCCALAKEVHGQVEWSKNVTITVFNKELKAVLKEVSKMTGAKFLYSREIIQPERKITVAVKDKPLSEFLAQILSPLRISFELDKKGYIFLNALPPPEPIAVADPVPADLPGLPPRKITGRITAADGTPIDGVSVMVKGSTKGTTTNKDGRFELMVTVADKTLVITAMGFEKREFSIGAETSFMVKLARSATNLDDVVVIGYGEQKRKDVTGSISSIKAEDIKNVPQTGIDQMLQGRVAGVSVSQNSGEPGGGVSVRIRGITTLQANNEPLYVIDGVPVDGNSNNDIMTLAGDGENKMSALSGLNPSDILSVDILKDASAAAIYGNRAANGVVLITTKKGRSGEGKISFNTYQGVQKVYKNLDLLDLKGYAAYKNSIADYTGASRQPEFANLSLLGTGTNWQKEIFTPAIIQNHDISFSGGKTGSTYYISGNYYKQEGTIIGSGFDRKSMRINLDNQLKSWFKVGANASFSATNQQVTLANTVSGIVALVVQQSPDVPVYLADGSFGGPNDQTNFGAVGVGNPVAQAKTWKTNLARNKLISDVYGQVNFLKNFSFRTDFGTDMNWNVSSTFLPTYNWGAVTNTLNKYAVQNSNSSFWNLRNILTWHAALAKHDMTVMAGQEANKSQWDNVTASRSNFPSNDITSLNLGDPTTAAATESRGQATQESFFTRAIYSYDNRYALTATLRRDQSSKFAPGHQIGYFPAVSAAWTLTHEKFLERLTAKTNINLLKLRLGYGEVGNQNIPNYTWGSALSSTFSNTAVGSGSVLTLANFANPNVQWEHATQWNLGIDLGISNRLGVTVDLYNKISKGFLLQLPYPYYTGAPVQGVGIAAPYANMGEMQNKGYDVTVNYHNAAAAKTGWTSVVTLSHYLNTVRQLSGQASSIIQSINTGNTSITKTAPGMPVGQFFGYQVLGLFQTPGQLLKAPVQNGKPIDPKTGTYLGDIQFRDVNGDGKVDDSDRTYIGNPNPKFTFGFTNSFAYKGFDLSIFLQGTYGNDVFNYVRVWGERMTATSGNQMASVQNRWTPENVNTKMPRYANGDPNNNERVSDRFVEDGSYLRIQNVSLGYTFPPELLRYTKFVTRLHVYFSVQNLYTFTHYTGLDPEIGSYNGNPLLSGVDVGRYPVPRTITGGVNIEF